MHEQVIQGDAILEVRLHKFSEGWQIAAHAYRKGDCPVTFASRRYLLQESNLSYLLDGLSSIRVLVAEKDGNDITGRKVTKMITRKNLPRILIADDHTLVAEACKKLLESEYEIVATVSDGRALVRAAIALKPHVIIVDVAMPLLNGLDAGQQVKEFLPAVKLVYLTMSHDADLAAEAFRRGASAFLLKTCAASELAVAVREVLRGMSYLSPTIAKDTVDFLLRQDGKLIDDANRLTDRQREVLQLLAEGKCMKEVAGVLNITPRTVAFHKYRMMEVLNAKSSAELVQYAVRHHLIAA